VARDRTVTELSATNGVGSCRLVAAPRCVLVSPVAVPTNSLLLPPLASLTSGLYSACAATYGMAWCAGVAPRAHVQRRRTCYPDRSRAYACDRLGHVNLICQSVKSNQSAIGSAQIDLTESLPKHVRVPYTLIWTSRTAIKAMLFCLSCIYGSLEMLYADACEFR